MKKQTLKEQYMNALTIQGWKQVQSKSSKYETFYKKFPTIEYYIFVGKSGALRINTRQNSTTSSAMSDKIKTAILTSADKIS